MWTDTFDSGEQTEVVKRSWRKKRADRMLVDQLLRSGNYTAAQRLAESSAIEVGVVCLLSTKDYILFHV